MLISQPAIHILSPCWLLADCSSWKAKQGPWAHSSSAGCWEHHFKPGLQKSQPAHLEIPFIITLLVSLPILQDSDLSVFITKLRFLRPITTFPGWLQGQVCFQRWLFPGQSYTKLQNTLNPVSGHFYVFSFYILYLKAGFFGHKSFCVLQGKINCQKNNRNLSKDFIAKVIIQNGWCCQISRTEQHSSPCLPLLPWATDILCKTVINNSKNKKFKEERQRGLKMWVYNVP